MIKEIEYFLNGKINEECGVFGVFNVEDAAQLTYYGLHSLQHRGQEGAGIASCDGERIIREKGEGLVTEVFNSDKMARLPGNMSIGHVRYSTTGGGGIENVQPILVRSHTGDFVIAHNGNIVNAKELKMQLEAMGSIFHTTSDSEIIGHLIQREVGDFQEKILKALPKLEGAFSFLIMNRDSLYVIRDKNGFRPLSMGKLDNGFVFSSESSAFEIVGAEYIRGLKPGEVLRVSKDKMLSKQYTDCTQDKMCAMEYIYFSRPDSSINGLNVHTSRRKCGGILAKESPVEADIVIGVPDSSLSSAMGYSDVSGLPYELGLVKNRYVGRTFIKPNQHQRERGVKMKLSAMEAVVRGKRIVLVDDSIVRGTTSKHIIQLLKDAGAKEVHMRIASSPIISPCFYGVDTSTYNELISTKLNPKELGEFIGADSLEFLSHNGMIEGLGENICTACFTGNYPTSMFSLLENLKK
ncbi:amidophosphoribosyltransferase [Cetobacterium sp. 8H]|uniref:amidophosphoribosyltransferase n=1 Tax=Cetobacterium sp. 8H TaxID=2759681 RepID=UPI00163D05F2|nr:amidophosphoribosyltransferase [Cetobacterium sp. 8H]MBC2850652.1 amidophosphoribosyltransferase [Cetobacterium sp. 8H]